MPLLVVGIFVHGNARADEPLSAAELKAVLLGNTSIGSTSKGTPYWLYRNPDGSQALETDSGFTDEGNWWVTDDGKMCSKWEKIRDGAENCGKVYRVSKDRYRTTSADGNDAYFKQVQGNSENL